MNLVSITLAQTIIRTGRWESNLKTAEEIILAAAQAGSRLVLFPELFLTGYDLENSPRHAGAAPEIHAHLQGLADAYNLCIGGSLIESSFDKIYNTFSLFLPRHPVPFQYRKVHLFDLLDETRWFAPGDHLTAVSTPLGLTGMAICYDLRFPEMFRAYALSGVAALLLPAEWPLRRVGHWRVLSQARAIENQAFFIAVNCAGASGPDHFAGHSLAIDPWGNILAEGRESIEDILHLSLDLDQVALIRDTLPVFTDRRPDVYQKEIPPCPTD